MDAGRIDTAPSRYLLTCPGRVGEPCDHCALFREDDSAIGAGFDPFAALAGTITVDTWEPWAGRTDQWGRLIGCAILLGMSAHNYVRTGGDGGCKRCRCLPSHPIHGASGWWEGTRIRHGLQSL